MVTEHICIVFAEEHYNPLGVVRSLGENGIRPVGILSKARISWHQKVNILAKYSMLKTEKKGVKFFSNISEMKY